MDEAKPEELQQPGCSDLGGSLEAVTSDGQTVPITFDPDTGQYHTHAGEPVVIQVEDSDRVADQEEASKETVNSEIEPEEESSSRQTSDLSSLAAAAETHSVITSDSQSGGISLQNIRVLNADGTVTSLDQPPTQPQTQTSRTTAIRIINSDGSISTNAGQQQMRIVKMDDSVQQQQQIKIVNSDGTVSNLAGNIRVISANQMSQPQAKQYRVIRASSTPTAATSPTKTFTLAQAQQLGLITSSSATTGSPTKVKNIRISPVKGQSDVVKQVVIRSSTGTQPVQTTPSVVSSEPQVIRIPTSNLQPGTLQQIQVGNKMQYVRVVGATGGANNKTQIVTVKSGSGNTPILPATAKTATTIPMSALKIAIPPQQTKQQRVILPSGQQMKPVPVPVSGVGMMNVMEHFVSRKETKEPQDEERRELTDEDRQRSENIALPTSFEPSGVRPRKPCNCTKSQCLKLYCDCFANGEFCHNCNCNNCSNNLEHEEVRQKAIKQCLDRNPSAFKPKIGRLASDGERRHNKGCNCKRSGCLKNYCECYEAKIPCTDACRCLGCKNVEDEEIAFRRTKDTVEVIMEQEEHEEQVTVGKAASLKAKLGTHLGLQTESMGTNGVANKSTNVGKQPFSFITTEVVEATCQCLLAQAEEAERNNIKEEEIESLIIEEFGRCLMQIIDVANKSKDTNGSSENDKK